jgi:RNA polymerase sigma factor (sigma-70 family)
MQNSAGSGSQSEPTDERLLHDYVSGQDAGAFAAIVRRHGTVVLGVCRRILRDEQHAEDAFQATFLVLMRRARSLTVPNLLSNWLYGVAYRTACKIRSAKARQRTREASMAQVPAPDAANEVIWRDLRPILDDELQRLPPRFRRPIVLFYLEGKTTEEVACTLGCPKGTVLSRLARGRERLRRRLTRRGLAISGGVLVTFLARSGVAEGTFPGTLLDWSIRIQAASAAARATEGISSQAKQVTQQVLNDMFRRKLQMIGGIVLVGLLAVGTSFLGYRAFSTPRGVVEQPASRSDMDELQGTWQVVTVEYAGQPLAREQFRYTRLTFRGNTVIQEGNGRRVELTFQLDPSQKPKTIDMQGPALRYDSYQAIYELDGYILRVCQREPGPGRPREFASKPNSTNFLITARRSGP